jgi:hypothetical protein
MELQISVTLPDVEAVLAQALAALPASLILAYEHHAHVDDTVITILCMGDASAIVPAACMIGRLEGVLKHFCRGTSVDGWVAEFEITLPGDIPF